MNLQDAMDAARNMRREILGEEGRVVLLVLRMWLSMWLPISASKTGRGGKSTVPRAGQGNQ